MRALQALGALSRAQESKEFLALSWWWRSCREGEKTGSEIPLCPEWKGEFCCAQHEQLSDIPQGKGEPSPFDPCAVFPREMGRGTSCWPLSALQNQLLCSPSETPCGILSPRLETPLCLSRPPAHGSCSPWTPLRRKSHFWGDFLSTAPSLLCSASVQGVLGRSGLGGGTSGSPLGCVLATGVSLSVALLSPGSWQSPRVPSTGVALDVPAAQLIPADPS